MPVRRTAEAAMWAEEAPVWYMVAEVHIPAPVRPVPMVAEVIRVGRRKEVPDTEPEGW